MTPEAFIRANTSLKAPPHVPELRLHLADEAHDLWLKTEEELGVIGLPPPFWAFAWAGGQGLARHLLDHPHLIAGKTVLDFATGSGIVAIAAVLAGARDVTACDIDSWACKAAGLNAAGNGVALDIHKSDLLGEAAFDVILAGDVFYDREMAASVWPRLQQAAAQGCLVLVGDPGRSYVPRSGLEALATYEVPVLSSLEDSDVKKTTVWQVVAPSASP
jgi:predicted nicotinamide N-methyase